MKTFRVLVCAVICFAATRTFAQDYEIRMNRPTRAGAKYELSAIASKSLQTTTTSTEGRILNKAYSSLAVKLEGIVTVLQIGTSRQATKLKVAISECMVSRDGEEKEREALAEGTQVVVQLQNGETEYLIDGRPVSKDIAEILGLLFSLRKSNTTDDDVFGTKERKKIGDTWAINSEKAAADLAKDVAKVEAADIKGATTLEKIVEVDGVQCLRITGKLALNNAGSEIAPRNHPGESSDVRDLFRRLPTRYIAGLPS